MAADIRTRTIPPEDEDPNAPGMAEALLTVLVMIVATAIVALFIYLVMFAIAPIEPRTNKAAQLAPPALQSQETLPARLL